MVAALFQEHSSAAQNLGFLAVGDQFAETDLVPVDRTRATEQD